MSFSFSVRAVRNTNSRKLFVLLDEKGSCVSGPDISNSLDEKITIINPEGRIITVPGGLFQPPFLVTPHEILDVLTSEQVKTISQKFASKPRVSNSRSRSTRSSSGKKKLSSKSKSLGASWSSSKLTFYKHKIEPLRPSQSFEIRIESLGTFLIKKEEFLKVFNDVVISSAYWQEGSFTYESPPEKAGKFITAI